MHVWSNTFETQQNKLKNMISSRRMFHKNSSTLDAYHFKSVSEKHLKCLAFNFTYDMTV